MARPAPARSCAAALLREARLREARMRDLLRGSRRLDALGERDRALASRLCLGVVRTSGLLDALLAAHLRRGFKLEPRVRDALRLAAFELLFMGTPAEVAVSQGVELARAANARVAGLANAVLRRVAETDVPALAAARARLEGPVGTAADAPLVDDVALVGAVPAWLAGELVASCGMDRAAALALAALEAPCASVAANRARHTPSEALALLEQAGCAPEAGPLPGSLVLGRPSALASSGLVAAVDVVPADLAAQEVALLAGPRPGERVLEVGQGRGTKSILLESVALAAGGPCELVAVELEEWKSALSARRMEAAGLSGQVACLVFDGRNLAAERLPPELAGTFDLVFVDAPCSGTGTLRRHAEIAWSLAPESVDELAALQLQILSAAAARVGVGGRLAYATCSLLPRENEAVVQAFLAGPAGSGFTLFRAGLTQAPGADSHFLALLERPTP